jgi:hypothetical protein
MTKFNFPYYLFLGKKIFGLLLLFQENTIFFTTHLIVLMAPAFKKNKISFAWWHCCDYRLVSSRHKTRGPRGCKFISSRTTLIPLRTRPEISTKLYSLPLRHRFYLKGYGRLRQQLTQNATSPLEGQINACCVSYVFLFVKPYKYVNTRWVNAEFL